MSTSVVYKAKSLIPINSRILVKSMEFHERVTTGGIILPGDDGTSDGIRPRWGEVCFVGPSQHDVEVGEWVLIEHGRWTRGVSMIINDEEVVIRMIDETAILLVSTEKQTDETRSTAVKGESDRERMEGSLHNDGTQDKCHISKG